MARQSSTEVEGGRRSKRAAILDAAIDAFGEQGYEATKWSLVADQVGIGQTALYHYFESKVHCLLTIMRSELSRSHEQFLKVAGPEVDPPVALRAALEVAFEATQREVLAMRVLQNHMGLLETPRASKREEEERRAARALVHDIEVSWTTLLERGMAGGQFPRRDSYALAQAVLGMVVSVWRWYRWGGRLSLNAVRDFYVDCGMRMVEAP